MSVESNVKSPVPSMDIPTDPSPQIAPVPAKRWHVEKFAYAPGSRHYLAHGGQFIHRSRKRTPAYEQVRGARRQAEALSVPQSATTSLAQTLP